MKELDQLLLAYLEQRYPTAPEVERQCFSELLELPDPQIWAYLSGRETPVDEQLSGLIQQIAQSGH